MSEPQAQILARQFPGFIEDQNNIVVENKAQLVAYLESGIKAKGSETLGIEDEWFVYHSGNSQPVVYDGDHGIKALLYKMSQFGWEPIYENNLPLGLYRGNTKITLEPGGQLELSTAPSNDVHHIFREIRSTKEEFVTVARELGVSYLALGYQPKYPRESLPWMPKQRYQIMRSWMQDRGSLGLDMMQGTCAIQSTIDFTSEADMVKKFRVGLALQPLVTAMFANSPFSKGQPNGYLSYRNKIWSHTDPDRCGPLDFVFEQGMSFERYVDYMLDIPMYFVRRGDEHIDASGLSFRDFLMGNLQVLPGENPLLSDWNDHLTTAFPSVRLKQYLELRAADAGDSTTRAPALAALWAGLLYDEESLNTAYQEVSSWTREERYMLELGIAKNGFKLPFKERTVRELCIWMLDLSGRGLKRRSIKNADGKDESVYLIPLLETVEEGITFAEILLQRYEKEWYGDIDLAIEALYRESFL